MSRSKRAQKKTANPLLEALLDSVDDPLEALSEDGLLRELKKRLMERALESELTEHLGYEKHDRAGDGSGNSRNGHASKTVLTGDSAVEIDVPRDRAGTFEPKLVPKNKRRIPGFDEKVISLYARGLSVREVQGHLEELYGVEVSPSLISRVTDGVLEEVNAWQSRRLEPTWPIVYLDALVVKVRDDGVVGNKSAYLALGVNMEGRKEVLGLWIAQTEGAKFWLHVLTELKNRGVEDILVAVCDGLTGFPDAIAAAFPQTTVQTCIVHMVRNSLRYVSWGNRKAIAAELRKIYRSATVDEAEAALTAFEESDWGTAYPSISRSWRTRWEQVIPFFAFAPEIRRAIYTTNAIEALNRQLRKTLKTRGAFPTEEAAVKLLWLSLERASRTWTMPIRQWDLALQQLAIHFPNRLSL